MKTDDAGQSSPAGASHRPTSTLPVQVSLDGALQPARPLAHDVRQRVQVVGGRDAEPTHKVARRALEVAVVVGPERGGRVGVVVLGPAEVGVARDGGGAVEVLQPRARVGLGRRVEGGAAEELVRRNALLRAELVARVALGVVCKSLVFFPRRQWEG